MHVVAGGAKPGASTPLVPALEAYPSTPGDVADLLAGAWAARRPEATLRNAPSRGESQKLDAALGAAARKRSWTASAALFARRAVLQEIMKPGALALDATLMALAGAVFGAQAADVEVHTLATMVLWVGIGLQLFIAVTSLRVLGPERVVYWREVARGSGMALPPTACRGGVGISRR